MKHWNVVLEVTSNEMLEHGVDMARDLVSPVTSGDRKRSLSAEVDVSDGNATERILDAYSTMSLPVGHTDTGFSSPRPLLDGGHTSSYPVSPLYYSPSQKYDEAGYNESYSSQSLSSSAYLSSQRSSSYRQLADSNGGYDRLTSASYTEQEYSGQYDFHEYPYLHEAGDAGRRNDEGNIPPHVPPPTKRNRFNLSRYQLDDDEDLFATTDDQSVVPEVVKPNWVKTQRERLMQTRVVKSEESDSTAPGFEDTSPSHGGEDPSSRDSIMPQRERLRHLRNEHCQHVVIPNQWEGEENLHEFVAFGNIEAALRPLGLMMARAALVNDSVTTRHHRSSSSGPSGRHSNRSNSLQAL